MNLVEKYMKILDEEIGEQLTDDARYLKYVIQSALDENEEECKEWINRLKEEINEY